MECALPVSGKWRSLHPYQWVYIKNLADFKVKDAERGKILASPASFAQVSRHDAGKLRTWTTLKVLSSNYLTGIGNAERAKLVSNQDSLFSFATENFQPLFQIADVVEAELVKLGK